MLICRITTLVLCTKILRPTLTQIMMMSQQQSWLRKKLIDLQIQTGGGNVEVLSPQILKRYDRCACMRMVNINKMHIHV
mgnify:CR=1 FL=1